MKMKSMLNIKNFSFRSQTNGIDDLEYILRHNTSQTSTSNSKYKRNWSFSHSYICLYFSHPQPYRSLSMKSHMWWQNWCWKSKTFRFAHRQIILMTYNTSYDAIQAKYRPLTPSRNETIPFFSHPYPFIPHTHNPTDLYQWKVTCDDKIDAENQKLFVSLTDKSYWWLIIHLMMQFKPNIDL